MTETVPAAKSAAGGKASAHEQKTITISDEEEEEGMLGPPDSEGEDIITITGGKTRKRRGPQRKRTPSETAERRESGDHRSKRRNRFTSKQWQMVGVLPARCCAKRTALTHAQ